MKDASGSPRACQGPYERALEKNIAAETGATANEERKRLQTLTVPGKPRFPPRSDCAESIDPHSAISF